MLYMKVRRYKNVSVKLVVSSIAYLWKHLRAITPKSVPATPPANAPDQLFFNTISTALKVS